MEPRDAILHRIRTELAKGPPVDQPPVAEVWPCTSPTTEQMAERFEEELRAVQGEVIHCDSMEDARAKLAELMDDSQWSTLGCADRTDCRELVADVDRSRVAWAADGWDPKQMAELDAGLVEAEYLLADTGSCLVDCGTPEERLMCYLPPACVVIARRRQLFEHLQAAWQQIAARAAEPDRRGEHVIITGPSRTADIEKILILGVHGPKRLVVMLVR